MSPPKSSKRSLNTCAECRARKVRCEGNRPVCSHCERLGLNCSFQRSGHSEPEAVWERRRVRLACASCHALKARCSGQLPKCQRCRSKGIDCVYAPSKRASHNHASYPLSDHGSASAATPDTSTSWHEASPSGYPRTGMRPKPPRHVRNVSTPITSGSVLTSMPDEDLVMHALENFFKHIFPIPVFSFLHKPSIIQRYQAGLLDKAITLSIVGITSLLTDLGPGMREYGDECIAAAENMVMRDIGRPSVIKIQCLILIVEHRSFCRLFTTAFALHAIACRFAFALRLNYEAPKLCFLAQESRRRMMWSLYTLDGGLAGGISELALCHSTSLHIQLPCQERNFEFDLEQQTEPLQPRPHQPVSETIGSLGLYIRIMWLRGKVLQCTKEMVMNQEGQIDHFQQVVESLAQELDDFAASLPSSFHWSEKNLHLRAYSPRLCPFILIHIWWRQCYCDLFRFSMSGLREALSPETMARLNPDFVDYCRWQCFENARSLSDSFRSLLALRRDLPVTGIGLHVSAYQCARLLFYSYRNHAAALSLTVDAVNDYARQCAEVLDRLPIRTLIGDSIQRDLHRLIATGASTGMSPSRQPSPSIEGGDLLSSPKPNGTPDPNHLFSRHGIVNHIGIVDDSDSLTMPSTIPAEPMNGSGLVVNNVRTPSHDLEIQSIEPSPVMVLSDQFSGGHTVTVDGPGAVTVTNVPGALEMETTETDAFQGALDEFYYDPNSIAVDPFNWSSSYWNSGDFGGRNQIWAT